MAPESSPSSIVAQGSQAVDTSLAGRDGEQGKVGSRATIQAEEDDGLASPPASPVAALSSFSCHLPLEVGGGTVLNVGDFLRSLWRGGEVVSKCSTCQGFSRTYIMRMNEMLAQKLGTSFGRGLFATVLKFAEY